MIANAHCAAKSFHQLNRDQMDAILSHIVGDLQPIIILLLVFMKTKTASDPRMQVLRNKMN